MIVEWLHLFSFFLCLGATAFFGASETALMSVSLSAWDRLRSRWPRVQAAYEQWTSDPSLVIATLLFGNTLASLGASVVANSLALHFAARHPVPVPILLFFTSLFAGATILIFGEILPKLFARHASERVVAWSATPLLIVTRFLSPALSVLSGLTEAVKKLLSFMPSEPLVTTEDLRSVVSAPQVEGLTPSARRMLSNIINFEQVKVSEVMIPRNHVIAIRLEQNVERMFEHIVRSGFSRVPVYFGTMDNIVGVVYAKDLLLEWRSSGLLVLEDLLRTPFRIAPEAPLSALLQGFRQGHHLAVVSDAQGRTQGIVTVEDVVEAIVGDIADEFDQPR
jgi:putative hemolysin